MTVRSFTSSFNEHVPDASRILHAPWVRTLIFGALLFLLFFGAWEGVWRARGFSPSLIDDAALWASARRSVGRDSVVLVGASKSLLGINPQVFAEESGGVRPIHLSIDGSQAAPVLKNLAEDNSFRGIVLFDLMESEIDGTTPPGKENTYLQKYMQQNISDRAEQWLRHRVQATFVFPKPEIAPKHVWEGLRSGQLPQPFYLQMQPDRYARADYSKVDLRYLNRPGHSTGAPLPQGLSLEEFLNRTAKLEEYVARIQERGGRVIYLRMPSSGQLWEGQEARYPKSVYWDTLAGRTKALTIHFRDYAELSQYQCPDQSHLDYRQAEDFTRNLVRILISKGVLSNNHAR
jgi:hypothetical protein